MNLIYLVLASPVIWWLFYWFFCNYSFSKVEGFEERFLLDAKSNENIWKVFRYSFQLDFKSRWKWFMSTYLFSVVFFAILMLVAHFWQVSTVLSGGLFVANVVISADKIAHIKRSKDALKNLAGDCSIEALDEIELKWESRKLK